MSLKRVGGKEDGGIDLLGWWWLPHESSDVSATSLFKRRRIRVIGQCKAEKKKMGPNYVRELEGVLFRFFTSKTDTPTASSALESELDDDPQDGIRQPKLSGTVIALLISQSSFTKSTILRANSSPIPFCLLHIPELEPAPSERAPEEPRTSPVKEVGTAWCNPALLGLPELKGRMEVRWERHPGGNDGRPALWWDGNPLPSWTPDSTVEKNVIVPDDS